MKNETTLTKISLSAFLLSVFILIVLKSQDLLEINSISLILFSMASFSLIGLTVSRNKKEQI